MASHVLTVKTPMGRAVRRRFHVAGGRFARGLPLGRVRRKDIAAAGIERVPKATGARGGRPLLDIGRILEVANVIWCTGFVPDFGWIDLPVFAADGGPVHERGIVASEPGLYFLGLVFSSALASSLVGGSVGTPRTSPSTLRHANPTAGPPSTWWPERDNRDNKDQRALVS
jgi:putative flavoprotein involved in K+ transport